eukprot:jgi/Mesvir1/14751/Mv05394-RA.1
MPPNDCRRPLRRNVSASCPGLSKQLKDTLREHVEDPDKHDGLSTLRFDWVLPAFTFRLPYCLRKEANILAPDILEFIYSELLDSVVQQRLEEEGVLNFDVRNNATLYAMRTSTDGDCLLHAVSLAMWGVQDRDHALRNMLSASIGKPGEPCSTMSMRFYSLWREELTEESRADGFNSPMTEDQWDKEWFDLQVMAADCGRSLEPIHVFILAHIVRRPILVYANKFIMAADGEMLAPCRVSGVYLPYLWEDPSIVSHTPIALCYHNSHFSALVTNESEYNSHGEVSLLPLCDCTGRPLPLHFKSPLSLGCDSNEAVEADLTLMLEWMDCVDLLLEDPPAHVATKTAVWHGANGARAAFGEKYGRVSRNGFTVSRDVRRGQWSSLKAQQVMGRREEFYKNMIREYINSAYDRYDLFLAEKRHEASNDIAPDAYSSDTQSLSQLQSSTEVSLGSDDTDLSRSRRSSNSAVAGVGWPLAGGALHGVAAKEAVEPSAPTDYRSSDQPLQQLRADYDRVEQERLDREFAKSLQQQGSLPRSSKPPAVPRAKPGYPVPIHGHLLQYGNGKHDSPGTASQMEKDRLLAERLMQEEAEAASRRLAEQLQEEYSAPPAKPKRSFFSSRHKDSLGFDSRDGGVWLLGTLTVTNVVMSFPGDEYFFRVDEFSCIYFTRIHYTAGCSPPSHNVYNMHTLTTLSLRNECAHTILIDVDAAELCI